MTNTVLSCSYLIASALCILAIRGLASPRTAHSGNILGMVGMSVAVIATLSLPAITDIRWILAAVAAGALIGIFSALKVKMTALPQMIAAFNGLGGLAAVFIDPEDKEVQLNEFTAVMLALLLIAFLVTGTIKVAREITTGLIGGLVDTEFQKKLLGIALLVAHAVTGGLTKALTKVGFVMRAQDKLNHSALGKAMEKRRELIDTINRLAGRRN